MRKILYLIFGFILSAGCFSVSNKVLNLEKKNSSTISFINSTMITKNTKYDGLIENSIVDRSPKKEIKKNSKFKYAIFDICQSFWKKSLYELLYSYQKKHGKTSWSYYFKLIRYGASYALGTLNTKEAYESFLSYMKGAKLLDVKKRCSKIWQEDCKKFVLKAAKNNFDQCKEDGIITIISDSGIKELYDDLINICSFDYICSSELEFKDGVVTGKLLGEPCSGQEKLKKIKNLIENKLGGSLKDAIFYANSHNDIPLLNEVGKPVIVNPTSKLKKYAKLKKWEILTFTKVVES
ncbi:HAD family hydrolase [Candidatus Dependentiae bacterium]